MSRTVAVLLLGASALVAGCGASKEKTTSSVAPSPAEQRLTNGNAHNITYFDASPFPNGGNRIVFHSGVNTGGPILTQRLGSRSPETAGPSSVIARKPRALPDGRIVYIDASAGGVSDAPLTIMSKSGTSRQRLGDVGYAFDLAATKDGSAIYYGASKGGRTAIHRTAPDGSGEKALPTDPKYSGGLAISPDGRRIAYTANTTSGAPGRILVASSDGTGARQVARGASPVFSPDGRRIAYLARAGTAEDGLPLDGVFVIPAAGGKPVKVDASRRVKYGPLLWLDDGRLVFVVGDATADYGQLFAVKSPGA
jgi:Tol biopolymer transport system component